MRKMAGGILKRRGSGSWRVSPTYRVLDTFRLMARLFRRYPLRADEGELPNPLFIVGSGRSGNTLLRAILVAHGELAIPPESYVLGRVIQEYFRFSFLPWTALARLVLSEFESYPQFPTWGLDLQPLYSQAVSLDLPERNLAHLLDLLYRYYAAEKQPSASRWGDKTPLNTFYLDEIDLVFPRARYLHMVRDGRDVVASYLRTGIYTDLDEAADRWLRSVDIAIGFGAKIGPQRYMELHYEALVTAPEPTIQDICQFLDLEYREDMLDFQRVVDRLGDTHQAHHTSLRKPLGPHSIGKWRSDLPVSDQTRIQHLLGQKLAELGY